MKGDTMIIGLLMVAGLLVTQNSFTQKNDCVYLFSHGIADTNKQVLGYTQSDNKTKPYIITNPFVSFDYPDASSSMFRINRTQTSFAQENEIQRLSQVFFSPVMRNKNAVLVGVSRGASVLVNFMGIYNASNVAALILESPFDCVESIVLALTHEKRLSWIPGIKKNGLSIMSFIFCKYNPKGIRPIDLAAHIKQDLPILIICSGTDILVPVWSSINIYKILRESGHYNTYLLILPEGVHAKLINDTKYGSLYQKVTHAFYKKFQLPHDPALAQQGIPYLANCQPDSGSLESWYPSYHAQNSPNERIKKNNFKKN